MIRIKIKLRPKEEQHTGLYKKMYYMGHSDPQYKELSLEELRKAMTELYFRDTNGKTKS